MAPFRISFFILFLITIGQTAIDIYLPSLPTMVHELNTTATDIQLSLSAFLVGFSVSQLIYGPLSDHHGRKPILLIGLSIFLVGSIVCTIANNIEIFFIGRIIQGLGIGAASALSRAISRDVFEGKKLAKISAYTSMAWAVIPIIAPLIGSYVQAYLGWRYNFALLSIFAILFIISIVMIFPETRPLHLKSAKITPLKRYKELLQNKIFLKYILCVMIIYGIFVDFNIAAPFLIQDIFKQSVVAYGWWIVFVASGFLIGSYLSSRLVHYLSASRIIMIGVICLVIISIILSILAILKLQSVLILVLPMFFVLASAGLIYPQLVAESLSPFPKMAGSAGALFGFMVFLGGTIASVIISHLHENNAIPVSSMILAQAVLVLIILIGMRVRNGEAPL